MNNRLLLWLIATCLLPTLALASMGDRSSVYRSCVSFCEQNTCTKGWEGTLALRLTRWTCTDDCKYNCMHLITDDAISKGAIIHQYHGKWPFWRWAGMQEPASVVFSMMNLLAHLRGAGLVKRKIPVDHPMRNYYIGFALVSVNAWCWSSVFHTRDLSITEKMDYFSAAAAIMYALYYTVIRLFHLYPNDQNHHHLTPPYSPRVLKYWALLCTLLFVGHVSYLSLLPRFDYAYNIIFNLGIGMTHNILWLIYSIPFPLIRRLPTRPKSYYPGYAYQAAFFVLLTTSTTSLELLDFPPLERIIDAHALWHLVTVPLAYCWYDFLVEDALDGGWGVHEK